MLYAACDVLGYPRHLHRAACYKDLREDVSLPGEAAGDQIAFPQTPQIAAEICADI